MLTFFKTDTDLISFYSRNYSIYPLVMLIFVIPKSLDKIFEFSSGNSVYFLFIFHILSDALIGTIISAIFAKNTNMTTSSFTNSNALNDSYFLN